MQVTEQHTDEIQYLRAASPELREALVMIAQGVSIAVDDAGLPHDAYIGGDHPACKAVKFLAANPRQALLALLNGDTKPKRGRPRGVRSKPKPEAKAAEAK